MPSKNSNKSEDKESNKKIDRNDKYPARWGDTPLRDVFDRFLDDRPWLEPFEYLRPPRMLSRFDRAFYPRVDVSETNTEVKVVADVPGINPDNIDVYAHDNRLHISGKAERVEESKEGERPYRYERTYGAFRRDIALPARVQEEEIRAVYKDGVLTITVPKAEEERHTKVVIEKA